MIAFVRVRLALIGLFLSLPAFAQQDARLNALFDGRAPIAREMEPVPPPSSPDPAVEQALSDIQNGDARRRLAAGNFLRDRFTHSRPDLPPFHGQPRFELDPEASTILQSVGALAKRFALNPHYPAARKAQVLQLYAGMIQQTYFYGEFEPAGQKRFLAALHDPGAIYAALSISPIHARIIGEAMIGNLRQDLAGGNRSLLDWTLAQDPNAELTFLFFQRLCEMNILPSFVNSDSAIAAELPALIFSPASRQHGWDPLRTGNFINLMMQTWNLSARGEFLIGLAQAALEAQGIRQRELMILLQTMDSFYADKLGAAEREAIESVMTDSSPEPFLAGPDPGILFGPDRSAMRGVLVFDEMLQFQDFLADARREGYAVDAATVPFGTAVKGRVHLDLMLQPAPQDEDAWFQLFKEKFHDLEIMATRGEPWFSSQALSVIQPLLNERPRLLLLGSCRTVTRISAVLKDCPQCAVVANAETGYYSINNPVLFATLDTLAGGGDWMDVDRALTKRLPKRYAEILGPWHFAFAYRDALLAAK